ncbi:Formin binding protein [Neofusicoccum parvum]|uniref:Formin binding protein n=1 Tax=Neofusicoccum parvum TaxID=310453 RepID=A0ACB5RRJ4_9PEZI|nr:Formin binding protein [Neofusicoccum parvum]
MPGLWQEARTADGRVYYYNTQTKVTQWTKPNDLLTPAERALKDLPWKEYTAEGGKKYWYNTETKQSSWEMPEAYRAALAQSAPPARPPAAPATQFVAGGASNFASHGYNRDTPDRIPAERQIGYSQPEKLESLRSVPSIDAKSGPEYSSYDDAEAAFMKLLKRSGVQPDWPWEQAMRATIRDDQYRAIKDPKDRKAAFEKYVVEMREQEKEREKERLTKLRNDFSKMLRSHPEIKYYTRWKTAKPIIEGETIYRSAKSDEERKHLFEEYICELYKAHVENEAKDRQQASEELSSVLGELQLEPYSRWSSAKDMIREHERFKGDEKFELLSKLDLLKAFEAHIKTLERSFNEVRQKQKASRARRERQNRDKFIALLKELRSDGKIRAGTKWKEIHPLLENDPRYTAMLGQAGSTPLDLFWDVVEEEERVLRSKRHDVLDVLDDRRFEITQSTTLDEFMSLMQAERRTANIDQHSLTLLFERLKEKEHQRSEANKHQAERAQRRHIDNLRSRIKRLEPPVTVEDTWEQVRPRLEKFEEYRLLESDEARRTAFDKHLRRLKEKEDDHERERERERDRSRRDHRDRERERDRDRERDRERDRDRDYRNGHGRRHRTRTPEPDAYEADRRKAQADRERQYRKSSLSGLSPPPRSRDWRGDRYVSDRREVSSLSHYDRERREREVERERSYISRADPREKASELDYGDSRAGSMRRRRDSESPENKRDTKRTRRETRERTFSPRRHRSRTPEKKTQAEPPKEDPGLRSGSEEGEIEED